MCAAQDSDLGQIMARIGLGDDEAKQALLEIAYNELRGIAARLMQGERAAHTLQPTALVHEAALQFMREKHIESADEKSYFYWAMARAMRQVLVAHARRRNSQQRGGRQQYEPFDSTIASIEKEHQVDVLALSEALDRLDTLGPRQAEVVTMRFFGGFQMNEIAQHLGVSLSTVEKDWQFARAWLARELEGTG